MGYQYQAADDLLEIDITYQCNLKCNNCNRSSAQAPDKIHIGLEEISQFVEDSLCQHRSWRKIRILGGEPTLHPELNEILSELHRLKIAQPDLCIQLVTNGYGRRVNTVISKLPDWLSIENSAKQTPFSRFGHLIWRLLIVGTTSLVTILTAAILLALVDWVLHLKGIIHALLVVALIEC